MIIYEHFRDITGRSYISVTKFVDLLRLPLLMLYSGVLQQNLYNTIKLNDTITRI